MVRLKGDLDADSVQHTTRLLQSALRGAPKWLEVDLSRVERLNADGILPLFLAARAARAQGVELTFTHAQGQVREVMRRMGLERFLSANASGQ
ncbi:STAS domain-containing protein [Streptomyces zaomyceticus]|uniref:STAS domain-containing protein n=1 Tax=Streptomyces TaxID=1883 RepID=UPI00371529BF